MAASISLSEVTPMNPHYLPATARDDVPAWQQTVVAFLAEKERRAGLLARSRPMPGCSGRSFSGSDPRIS
jgi:hypothetical protein